VRKLWKSDNSQWSYGQEFGVLFFWLTVYNGSVPLAFRCMLFPKENRYQNYIVSFFEQQSVTHHFNLMRRIGLGAYIMFSLSRNWNCRFCIFVIQTMRIIIMAYVELLNPKFHLKQSWCMMLQLLHAFSTPVECGLVGPLVFPILAFSSTCDFSAPSPMTCVIKLFKATGCLKFKKFSSLLFVTKSNILNALVVMSSVYRWEWWRHSITTF